MQQILNYWVNIGCHHNYGIDFAIFELFTALNNAMRLEVGIFININIFNFKYLFGDLIGTAFNRAKTYLKLSQLTQIFDFTDLVFVIENPDWFINHTAKRIYSIELLRI